MRTLGPARSQVNIIETRKREHSRKPDEQYALIESCSPGPRLELFARYPRLGWDVWGDESDENIAPEGRVHRGYEGGKINAPYLVSHQRLTAEAECLLSETLKDQYEAGRSIREISEETKLGGLHKSEPVHFLESSILNKYIF